MVATDHCECDNCVVDWTNAPRVPYMIVHACASEVAEWALGAWRGVAPSLPPVAITSPTALCVHVVTGPLWPRVQLQIQIAPFCAALHQIAEADE